VRHRSALKNRIHATLIAHGHACPTSDLFGLEGRRRLARMQIPSPGAGTLLASLVLIDQLDEQIHGCERELRALGAEHPYLGRLLTIPGVGWVLGYTIAAEIGDITRFSSPVKLTGHTGLCPRVEQSGEPGAGRWPRTGPRDLRWALIEAAPHAARSAHYRPL
jgi:transposase